MPDRARAHRAVGGRRLFRGVGREAAGDRVRPLPSAGRRQHRLSAPPEPRHGSHGRRRFLLLGQNAWCPSTMQRARSGPDSLATAGRGTLFGNPGGKIVDLQRFLNVAVGK